MRKILGLVLLLGCITPLFGQSGSGATIWFYRPAGSGDATRVVFAVPARRLAALQAGELFALDVQPGVYRFGYSEAPGQGQAIVVAISNGEQVYVEAAEQLQVVKAERALANIQASQGSGPSDAIVPQRVGSASSGLVKPSVPERISTPSAYRPSPAVHDRSNKDDVRQVEIVWTPSWMRLGGVNMVGSNLTFTTNITEGIAIMGDIGGHQNADDHDILAYTYRAGPAFSFRSGHVSGTGYVLAGGAHVQDTDYRFIGRTLVKYVNTYGVAFSGGIGGHLDVNLLRWLSLRAIDGEWSPMYLDSEWVNGVRVGAGLSFRFGNR